MKYVLIVIVFVLTVSGCAYLHEIAEEVPHVEPGQDVAAISTLTKDIIPQPYGAAVSYALGYVSALIRRVYKKHKGSKG